MLALADKSTREGAFEAKVQSKVQNVLAAKLSAHKGVAPSIEAGQITLSKTKNGNVEVRVSDLTDLKAAKAVMTALEADEFTNDLVDLLGACETLEVANSVLMHGNLTPEDVDAARDAFERADEDNSNEIDRVEVSRDAPPYVFVKVI